MLAPPQNHNRHNQKASRRHCRKTTKAGPLTASYPLTFKSKLEGPNRLQLAFQVLPTTLGPSVGPLLG